MASIDEIRQARIQKLEILKKAGINPYPAKVPRDFPIVFLKTNFDAQSKSGTSISIAGRVMALRGQGAILFAVLFDGTDRIQAIIKKDILKDENDIYYINLEIDIDDDKTLKTISSFRKVPIHSELEEDLLNYIKSVKTNNLFKNKSNYFSIEFGEFKTKLGFGKKHVFHSFRNTLHDRLKQAKVQLQMINEIVGHGPEDEEKITNDYTNPYELHILKEAIEKISYKN